MTPTSATSPCRHARSCNARLSAAAATVALAVAAPAAANTTTPKIVAGVAPQSGKLADARLVGPSGQIYAPVNGDPLRWRRQGLGGIASAVRFAGHHNGTLFACGTVAPLFVLRGGVWHAKPLPNRGPASLATSGKIGAACVGRQVYTLQGKDWKRFGKTRGRVTAIWAASRSTVYVANTAGRLRRGRKAGKTATWTVVYTGLPRADFIASLIGRTGKQLLAVSDRGVLLRIRGAGATRVTAGAKRLRGMVVHTVAVGPTNQTAIAGRLADGTAVIVSIRNGRLVDPQTLANVTASDRVTTLIYDGAGRLVVATRAGRLLVRDQKNSWQTGAIKPASTDSGGTRFPQAVPARTQ